MTIGSLVVRFVDGLAGKVVSLVMIHPEDTRAVAMKKVVFLYSTIVISCTSVAMTGRYIYRASQKDKAPEEGRVRKTARFVGAVVGGALVAVGVWGGIAGVCVGLSEGNDVRNGLYRSTLTVYPVTLTSTVVGTSPTVVETSPPSVFDQCIPIQTGARNGPCNGQEVLNILKNSPHLPPLIFFEEGKLPDSIFNGVCSAKSLGFINDVLRQCSSKSTVEVNDCLQGVLEQTKEILPVHRDRQAAFNCITVERIVPDHMGRKMQALANVHDLEVRQIVPIASQGKKNSPEAAMRALSKFLDQSKETAKSVQTYLLRGLVYNIDARKLENFGHTTALAVTHDKFIYHDPADGAGFFVGPRTPEVFAAIRDGVLLNQRYYKFDQFGVFAVVPRTEISAGAQEAAMVAGVVAQEGLAVNHVEIDRSFAVETVASAASPLKMKEKY